MSLKIITKFFKLTYAIALSLLMIAPVFAQEDFHRLPPPPDRDVFQVMDPDFQPENREYFEMQDAERLESHELERDFPKAEYEMPVEETEQPQLDFQNKILTSSLEARFEEFDDNNSELLSRYEAREIDFGMQEIQKMQSELDDADLSEGTRLEYQQRIRKELKNLHGNLQELRADVVSQRKSVVSAGASIVSESDELSADKPTEDISDLEAELKYREELIAQLIEQLDADSSSGLEANLLAIQAHPIASGGVAVFALAFLYLFRGRIAELSGFGVKIAFNKKEK